MSTNSVDFNEKLKQNIKNAKNTDDWDWKEREKNNDEIVIG